MADIEAGRVDIVVVYKVDRLTRSLADFAKLVDVFDRHNVFFVSITQAFNTTTSMGRLTLNVLLSFAQFEREVTAERIRDKIAASKKRGQWMGGLPPLGYDNIDKRLVVNASEAETIKHIMTRYVALQSVRALKAELDRDGYKTKLRSTKKQSQTGGKAFSRGHLYKLLSNPVYIGKVTHKGECYEGQHASIIDHDLWHQVQDSLRDNAPKRKRSINLSSESLLTGLIYDGADNRLSPTYTKKPNGRRYRYYISTNFTKGEADDGTALRLPAEPLEKVVVRQLTTRLSDTSLLLKHWNDDTLQPSQISNLQKQAEQISARLTSSSREEQRASLIDLVERIQITPDRLKLNLRHEAFSQTSSYTNVQTEKLIQIEAPLQMKRRGVETKLIIGGQRTGDADPEILQTLANAAQWYEALKTGAFRSIGEISKTNDMDTGDVSRTLPLAFLAPSIVKDCIDGKNPADLTADALRRKASRLPLAWQDQRTYLGFTAT
jgi:DNA invertase Pin-like site-specific DNA recombinase